MISESYPWKQDLRRRKNLILKYNKADLFEKKDESTYTVIEKAIFYSAFIIRKLIDCGGKLSDEAENYSMKAFSVRPMKHVDILHRWPEEDSHDWEDEQDTTVAGKNVCNWLIHSFMFFFAFNEDGIVDSFCVTSDYFGALDHDKLARYQLFSESFFMKHFAQLDTQIVLEHGKNDWRKKENRSKQLDVFLRLKGVKI